MNNVIKLNNVFKVYRTGEVEFTALKDVSLTIPKGSYTSIMGPSGSGKSTLMNIIGLLDSMDSGEYFLNGTNIADSSDDILALYRNMEIGFIFQSFNLLSKMNVLDNVELPLVYGNVPKAERTMRAMESLKAVGLDRWARHRPNEISGGQKQRVAIARAMVTNPSLLLADEPTGNLDSQSAKDILSLIDELHKGGATVLLITHDANVSKQAERTILIKDGEIVDAL